MILKNTARLLLAFVILFSLAAGAAEEGPRLAMPVAAGALFYSAALLARNQWAPPLACVFGSMLFHPDGWAAGIGAGLLVALLLNVSVWLVRPVISR